MTLHVEDLEAIEERARRANAVRVSGAYADIGIIASVVREDVPALVGLVRQLAVERDRFKGALSEIASGLKDDACPWRKCAACIASDALEARS